MCRRLCHMCVSVCVICVGLCLVSSVWVCVYHMCVGLCVSYSVPYVCVRVCHLCGCVCVICVHVICMHMCMRLFHMSEVSSYGVASVSRLLKIIGLFCRIQSLV